MRTRNDTRRVFVGGVPVGGGAPVSVQTMGNVDPHDAKSISAQIERAAAAGCDIFRLTVPDARAAEVLGEVCRTSPVPIVADIHFDWRCALAAIDAGADALRLNPGNIGPVQRVREVARAAAGRGIPIRIGVNKGSLEKDLREKADRGETDMPHALVESAMRHIAILENEGFRDIVVSAKASGVAETLATYRLLAESVDCPLHLGVTEAGTFLPGTVRSSVALGILLSSGIGDTVRVSLTDSPEKEVRVGMEILRALGLKAPGPSITSCPTCGRTKVDLGKTAADTETALEALYAEHLKLGLDPAAFPKVAVMGCVVNGPGEAKDADIALCGAEGGFLVYVKGKMVGKAAPSEAAGKVVEHALSLR